MVGLLGIREMEKVSRVGFFIWRILILLAALQEFASSKLSPWDCLLVEQKFVNMSNYQPKRCPSEINNFEYKELLHDCYKDVFRNCSPTETLICVIDNHPNSEDQDERKMICVEKSTVVLPEAPVISIKTVQGTSVTLLINSSSQNGTSVVNFYKITYKTTNLTVIRKAAHNNHDDEVIVLSNLEPDTTYIVHVEARDNDGHYGRANITVNTTSPPQDPPSEFPGWAIGVIVGTACIIPVVIVFTIFFKKRRCSKDDNGYRPTSTDLTEESST